MTSQPTIAALIDLASTMRGRRFMLSVRYLGRDEYRVTWAHPTEEGSDERLESLNRRCDGAHLDDTIRSVLTDAITRMEGAPHE